MLTQRQTFQKYFDQAEIKVPSQSALAQEAIAISPGVFVVFRDDLPSKRS